MADPAKNIDKVTEFAQSVARGLSDAPRRLDCRFLYDAEGSRLFQLICEQPEYYLTRTEAAILAAAAVDIAGRTGPATLIEFGSGDSTKTRLLFEAYTRLYGTVGYIPVDVSKEYLDQAHMEISAAHPQVKIDPFHGTYDQAFSLLRATKPVIFLFLGSTVGNLDQAEAARFWANAAAHLSAGDFCLLGIDINEDADSIHAAYNDAAGYSAAFTRNIFARINRELGANLDHEGIAHVARYRSDRRQVEIFAKFTKTQQIAVRPLQTTFTIPEGEMIQTEISRRFRLEQLVPYLGGFGLETKKVYTDSRRRFAVLLLGRKKTGP